MSKALSDAESVPTFIRHNPPGHSTLELTPCPDWRAAGESEHFVQFYDSDAFLVELHGGTVRADSLGEGLGASFTITLPHAPAPARKRSKGGAARPLEVNGTHAAPLPSLEGVSVLLVDDDRDTLNMLSAILTACRATVQTASSADDALEVLRWYKPDVLVSDLAMPEQDGYSLIKKIRALGAEGGRQIPAVALTAYVRVKDRARALSAGFNMFVPKPVESNELIAAIANLTESAAN